MSLRTEQQRVSPTFMVEMLVTALADPHQPRCCAHSVVACICHLYLGSHRQHNIFVLRSKHPQVYEAFARFLTVPRPPGEHARLREEMGVCKCDVADSQIQALHTLPTGRETSTYVDAGWYMETVVKDAVDAALRNGRLYKVEKRQQRAESKGKSVFWPRSPDDVLPYGIDTSISALASWIHYAPGDLYHLGLLTSIIEVFKKAAIPPILASPTLPGDLIRVAHKPFLIILGEMPGNSGSPGALRAFTPDDVSRGAQLAARLYEMLIGYFDPDELRALSSFAIAQTRAAEHEPGLDFVYICSLAVKALPILHDACSGLNMPARTQEIKRSLSQFRLVGGVLHRLLDLPLDITKYPEPIIRDVLDYRDVKDTRGVYVAVYDGLLTLWRYSRCWAPGCRATCTEAQRSFAACSGCARVTYCSHECQARAWRHTDVPHQAICETIKYIVDTVGLPFKPELANAAAVEGAFVSSGVERAALVQFRDHMDMLQKHTTLAPSFEPVTDGMAIVCSRERWPVLGAGRWPAARVHYAPT